MQSTAKITGTSIDWQENESIIRTSLSGPVDSTDVGRWRRGLDEQLQKLPDQCNFRIFVDFFGLAPVDVAAHKAYREVIPRSLARFGWKVGYLALFPEADSLPVNVERGVRCVAAVHCHQDSYKIGEYERRFGWQCERFMTDAEAADRWIRSLPADCKNFCRPD